MVGSVSHNQVVEVDLRALVDCEEPGMYDCVVVGVTMESLSRTDVWDLAHVCTCN